MIDDPNKVLGVSRDASDDEIKQVYRRLAKQYHPDRNPGDAAAAQKMQQINAAYEQIKNPERPRVITAARAMAATSKVTLRTPNRIPISVRLTIIFATAATVRR